MRSSNYLTRVVAVVIAATVVIFAGSCGSKPSEMTQSEIRQHFRDKCAGDEKCLKTNQTLVDSCYIQQVLGVKGDRVPVKKVEDCVANGGNGGIMNAVENGLD